MKLPVRLAGVEWIIDADGKTILRIFDDHAESDLRTFKEVEELVRLINKGGEEEGVPFPMLQ